VRVKGIISYDGGSFYGFQIQPNKESITSKILKSLKILNIETEIQGSGRTDRGVHASGQVIHFDIPEFWSDLEKLKNILNDFLSPNIYIKELKAVNQSFHSRFDAKRRIYRYIISTKRPNPFEAKYITFIDEIDEIAIAQSIKLFEGVHNFELFKKEGSTTKNYIREIFKTRFYKFKRDYYILYFEGNGFLRSQIRFMVGFLIAISEKKLSKENLIEQLNCKKSFKFTIAKPNGLYLAKIKY
jgi:tRNA pseudouridine38-40 synthase